MPPVTTILYQRRRRTSRHSRLPRRLGWALALTISLAVTLAGFLLAAGYVWLAQELPSLEALPSLLNGRDGLLYNPTRIYDRSGEHLLLELRNPAAGEPLALAFDGAPESTPPQALISATLASADPGFWSHAGYSLASLDADDHPTLAQRLVFDLLLWQEPPSLRRALRERLLAGQVASRFGREQILVWYLNSAHYGRLALGAQAAAQVYFGKPAAQLSLAEAAALAAAAQSPALNPLDAPGAALENSHALIQRMAAGGWIAAPQAAQALAEPLALRAPVSAPPKPAPAFLNLVLEHLDQRIPLERLQRGGFTIRSTLDYDLQSQSVCAAQAQIARLENRLDEAEELARDCPAASLLPTFTPRSTLPLSGVAASAVILDHSNGQILALVGDLAPGLDPAHSPGRPPGSLITPFIYLTGFTRGLSPASLTWDIPAPAQTAEVAAGEYHGPVRLRLALANDYFAPAEGVINQVGAE
ncbi:MAG: transglycosylase domain-containing protein, partial [Chloroflexi bacterium]|nr:transglycosylase domain-containing protein [Chloroflexota bacterium]